jgi:hypothetical protein
MAINMLEALRLSDVRNGAGDEAQSAMLEHFLSLGLIRLAANGWELTDNGIEALALYEKLRPVEREPDPPRDER